MKKLTLCLTSLIMFFVLFSISASAIDDDIVYLGDCGENITYTIYEDGKLVLNGNGNMTKYDSPFLFPWYQYHSLIKGVLIDDGITNISDYAFSYEYNNLETVTIADSVTDIGKSAFDNCTKLTKVVIGSGVVNIGESAFFGCEKLTTIVLPEGIWLPNRAERRALKKMKKFRGQDSKLDEYINLAQKTTKSEDFKQYVYMKTLEKLKEKSMEERLEEKEQKANGCVEGN